jgi:hypothetical protein
MKILLFTLMLLLVFSGAEAHRDSKTIEQTESTNELCGAASNTLRHTGIRSANVKTVWLHPGTQQPWVGQPLTTVPPCTVCDLYMIYKKLLI